MGQTEETNQPLRHLQPSRSDSGRVLCSTCRPLGLRAIGRSRGGAARGHTFRRCRPQTHPGLRAIGRETAELLGATRLSITDCRPVRGRGPRIGRWSRSKQVETAVRRHRPFCRPSESPGVIRLGSDRCGIRFRLWRNGLALDSDWLVTNENEWRFPAP